MWIQQLLSELHCSSKHSSVLWCDNLSVGALAANLVFHARTKHIKIDVHFVREQVLEGALEVRYVPSADQLADCLTKSLTISQFTYLRSKLGVVELPTRLRGDIKEKGQLVTSVKMTQLEKE